MAGKLHAATLSRFSRRAVVVSPGNMDIPDSPRTMVTATARAMWTGRRWTFTGAPAGFLPSVVVRRVSATIPAVIAILSAISLPVFVTGLSEPLRG
ncbi:hypothetical protein ASE75_14785 [Sphingomonas sp. Leaf17]|nr:hypothetical protein ASE75_14785 [Sphingomonas sp. Leaf17]